METEASCGVGVAPFWVAVKVKLVGETFSLGLSPPPPPPPPPPEHDASRNARTNDPKRRTRRATITSP